MSGGFRKIKPTKPNLDKLKKRREFASRGKRLLNLKREQILNEFRKYMKQFLEVRTRTRQKILSCYKLLNKSYMKYGKRRIKLLADMSKIHFEPSISINYVNYMGINLPEIDFDLLEKEKLPSYSFQDTPIEFDSMINTLKDAIQDIIKLARLNYIIFHFASSYRTIKRRINALDSILIPKLDEKIHDLDEILQDMEREEFVQMREIKDKLAEQAMKKSGLETEGQAS